MFAAGFLSASHVSLGLFGWQTAIEAAIALIAGVLLYRRVRYQESPLIPLDLIRIPVLRLSYITSICSFAAQMVAFVSLPFYLQERFGFDHVRTGLLITPWPLALAVTAPIAGRLVERISAGTLGAIGLTVMAAGFCVIAAAPVGSGIIWLESGMLACGAGFGFFQSPNNRIMLGTAPRHRSGAAAGMLATARLVGQTSGAVLVAFAFHLTGVVSRLPYVIGAVLSLVAAVASVRRQSSDMA